jgi:hypothetical protein
MRALLWPLNPRSAWAQPNPLKAGKNFEGAAVTCDSTVDLGSNSHCVGEHDSSECCFALC